jgi:hypothetical protein
VIALTLTGQMNQIERGIGTIWSQGIPIGSGVGQAVESQTLDHSFLADRRSDGEHDTTVPPGG